MKLKAGPLLVIGALVLLVGLTLALNPAPPPAASGHDHDHESETEESQADHKQESKKTEKPKFDLAKMKQAIESDSSEAASKALEDLQAAIVTTRDADEKKAFVDYAIALAQQHRSEAVRVTAVNLLKAVPELDSAVPLGIVQRDSSPQVREAALLCLSRFPAGGAVEQVLKQFAANPDPGLRNAATISLTQMLAASGQAGNTGLAALLGRQDNDAAAKAALALHAQSDKALPVLTNILYTSPNGPARHGAAQCIALICAGYNPSIDEFAKMAQVTHRQEMGHRKANPAGFKPLVWALANDKYAPTREIAAQGLGYLGEARAAAPLAAALKDPDALVRRRAAAALITVPAATVVKQLAETVNTDTEAEVRRFAVEALGWAGTTALAARDEATRAAVVPALNTATRDKSPVVRRYAAVELGRIADPASLEALSALLGTKGDPDADVRWAAVVALGKLRDKRAEHVLVQCLSDASPQVSNSAERALQKLGIASKEEAGFQG